ncbi:M23 family metallopeptidase [Chelativorans sp. M5D2P16]|uniref:M23 family metallopeptidase n=1 Tax=Chelativorans sp. M5D2P16 TaxID=3095678 RepID=UPI002ACAA654|nr:M23 family metallopeptidase [Chelativorans sp. M5D2P16]MDZ5697037.1 M23 family metallopeptidase [Chelativorans sp. M5D2P16]
MKRARSTASRGRREPPTIIIARGDDIRYFTLRPWMTAIAVSAAVILSLGYLGATAYLVLRDDLMTAAVARQARLQQAYEDRIAELRTRLDRTASRQLLDQQLMESKVKELAERQRALDERYDRLGLDRGEPAEKEARQTPPIPAQVPERRADHLRLDGITTGSAYAPTDVARRPWPDRASLQSEADHADLLFVSINRTLRTLEAKQIARVKAVTEKAYQTAETLGEAFRTAGIDLPGSSAESSAGGPLIAFEENALFQDRMRELDEVLDRLETLRKTARRIPVFHPVPAASVSSRFGMRRDPILRRPAYHAGVDFRVRHGAAVRAGGGGTVVKAGWNGSYGRMVEIDHGDGFSTRYAHLSRVAVKAGETVRPGQVIGRVGSSGRSTGPHLHYEVRRSDTAVDPLTFIATGRRIADYL